MLIASALLFMFTAISSVDAKDNIIKTFTLEERFGVSHPNQIVDFDLDISIDPKTSVMIDSENSEVPYQLLENGKKIAIRTGLPANTKRIWKLIKGQTSTPYKYGVKVTKSDGYYEINNSIVAVRIPMPTEKLDPTLAPIQGVHYPDGTWTANGPNYLTVRAGKTKSMEVKFLEQGDLKVIVEVLYKFHRPVYNYDALVYKEEGEGFYRSTIEIQSGQPSILFTEDTDMEFSYSMDL